MNSNEEHRKVGNVGGCGQTLAVQILTHYSGLVCLASSQCWLTWRRCDLWCAFLQQRLQESTTLCFPLLLQPTLQQ
ncbi:hypothetical protein Pmani_012352 [Petrolisthes manimaculis]|uniref:Uncharacterized protein n=1 Tax=Petrolisthes manimaculis TaxID=1843537 RepID=A0AAE1PZ55_9EUCA|nr:hypothetical protein Pmani_012352 [Petrolisthes manimaculis]